MYHVNNDGDVKICRATTRPCLFAIHGETIEKAMESYEQSMGSSEHSTIPKTASRKITVVDKSLDDKFDNKSFYGKQSPREVQLDALNGVVKELEETDATQLVAACGTGKTYMHRQLLHQAMYGEESSGIGVILTSSIKLATDTADGLRPNNGGYDESIGKFGEDYVVVEVHSGVSMIDGRQSVKEKGVINVDRIYNQIDEALKNDKKVVIVSTYDSINKVQEAQAKFENQDSVQADLLIHDEAHNVLGQQKPTTVSNEENALTAYVGFHNDVPGSLQARKRLYSTATPIVRETESDKESTGDLSELIKSSKKMQSGDQHERVTVYSDDPMVGKVGGFISQEKAIEAGCLAKPSYEIRESVVQGSIDKLSDPVVDLNGNLKERSDNPSDTDLNPNTYGALKSTLDAMVADSDGEKNSATNVLAYVGSIDQAEAFKRSFKKIALVEAKGMSLKNAETSINSDDPNIKRQARMRMLFEKVNVKAAHSKTDSDSVKEKAAAFEMFEGKAVKSNEWTPDKNVLANVNIFSEGVSISEIDTVVISDDDKLNEKSMTQAIGRAIRVVPDNDVKKYGHVIIPSVKDSKGADINSSSVNLAAYTSTRVERGTIASKLRGEAVAADETTSFTVYKSDGKVETKLAKEFAQNSISSVEDLAVAAEIENNHTYLLSDKKNNPEYGSLSKDEQFVIAKERVNEKLMRLKSDNPSLSYLSKVQSHIAGKTPREVKEMSRNGRVVSNALASGDISSLSPELAKSLISKGILKSNSQPKGITLSEKKEFLKTHSKEFSYGIMTSPTTASDDHKAARELLPESIQKNKKVLGEAMKSLTGRASETPNVEELNNAFVDSLENEEFVNRTFNVFKTADKKTMPMYNWIKTMNSIETNKKTLDDALLERMHNEASSGEQTYTVDSKSVRKTGSLNSSALKQLLHESF